MRKATIGALMAMLCAPLYGQQANAPDLASQNAALQQKVRDLEDRLIALEGKVRTLQSAQAPPAQPAVGQTAAAAPPPPEKWGTLHHGRSLKLGGSRRRQSCPPGRLRFKDSLRSPTAVELCRT